MKKSIIITFQFVPVEKLNRITRKKHQGVIAAISLVEFQKLENVIPGIFERGEVPFILVLDKVTDIRNFGAIVRTAECAGVHCIIIPIKNAAKINADAITTSAGAIYNMNICRVQSLKDAIIFLKESGLQVIAATEKSSGIYHKTDFSVPTALLMGSEDSGISHENMVLADQEVKIPLHGKTESLNVGSAAAILMYEIVRQRSL